MKVDVEEVVGVHVHGGGAREDAETVEEEEVRLSDSPPRKKTPYKGRCAGGSSQTPTALRSIPRGFPYQTSYLGGRTQAPGDRTGARVAILRSQGPAQAYDQPGASHDSSGLLAIAGRRGESNPAVATATDLSPHVTMPGIEPGHRGARMQPARKPAQARVRRWLWRIAATTRRHQP